MSAFLQIFQLMLGQKKAKSPWCTDSMPWWQHSWTSVFHYLDPSVPLLKRGHKKLQAPVLVNLFSMDGLQIYFNRYIDARMVHLYPTYVGELFF